MLVQPDDQGVMQGLYIGKRDELCLFNVELLPNALTPESIRVRYNPPTLSVDKKLPTVMMVKGFMVIRGGN